VTRFKSYMCAAGGLVILAGTLSIIGPRAAHSQGPSPVQVKVVNTTSEPVPTVAQGTTLVRSADEPARQPFQQQWNVFFSTGETVKTAGVTVPTGKRLVIEYASLRAQLPVGQRLGFQVETRLNGFDGFHSVPTTFLGGFNGVGGPDDEVVAGQDVRLYADPGTTVAVILRRLDGTTDPASVFPVISGHLVDLP
jgi:hypothetical protein